MLLQEEWDLTEQCNPKLKQLNTWCVFNRSFNDLLRGGIKEQDAFVRIVQLT